jgi:uncharacterized protein YjbI with pentapeptide repeats
VRIKSGEVVLNIIIRAVHHFLLSFNIGGFNGAKLKGTDSVEAKLKGACLEDADCSEAGLGETNRA